MKKVLYLLVLFLISCSTQPQVTVTSEVTVTLPPPTATETFVPPTYTATPAAATVTIGGVILALDENGVVTEMSVEGNYTDAQKAEKMAAVDPTKWGYKAGQAQIRVEGPNRFIEVIDGTEVVRVATWDAGTNEWAWNGEAMENLSLFNGFAKTTVMNGSAPADMKTARADSAKIHEAATAFAANKSGEQRIHPIYLYNGSDQRESIIGYSVTETKPVDVVDKLNNGENVVVVDGAVFVMTNSGKVVKLKLDKVDLYRRTFN